MVQTYIDSTINIPQQRKNVNNFSKKKIDFEDIEKSYFINNFDYKTTEVYEDELLRRITEDKSVVVTKNDLTKWAIARQLNNKIHWFSNNDPGRNLDFLAGNNKFLRLVLQNEIEKPFYSSKAKFANDLISKMESFYNIVVEQYGIKKGSRESAALQRLSGIIK